MHAQSVMRGLREIGINLQGARNSALRELVLEIPPAVVAEMFSYPPQQPRGTPRLLVPPGRRTQRCATTVRTQDQAIRDLTGRTPRRSPPGTARP
jgi:hypothetical protein